MDLIDESGVVAVSGIAHSRSNNELYAEKMLGGRDLLFCIAEFHSFDHSMSIQAISAGKVVSFHKVQHVKEDCKSKSKQVSNPHRDPITYLAQKMAHEQCKASCRGTILPTSDT